MKKETQQVVELLKEAKKAGNEAFMLIPEMDDIIEIAKLIQRQEQINKGK